MAVALDTATRRDLLQRFDFVGLFIELGWDYLRIPPVAIERDGHAYILRPVAEKKGVQIFECAPGPDGRIPPYAVRRQIERELTKQAHEHLIIFVDANRTTQTWQWVTREHGRPARPSEHTVYPGQSGQALLQALDHVTFHINDEEGLTLLGVVTGLTSAFDKDRVTKKFYDRFQKEHGRFLGFIEGIADHVEDQKWYASVMLNRLMFVYFIQKQGFLDGNTKYLTDRLQRVRAERGDGQFHIFYKAFLRRLFHGLNTPEADRDAALERLIGRVPYLNGGLFDEHELEQRYPKIDIPDEAFDTLFAFFDAYTWHLDDRPLRDDTEINPDVLGYIFEKYVNQKQMGAYYTKEDITGYIAKNTVIPAILDKAKAGCAVAFRPDGYVWRLLQENPDRYIYDAVKKGIDLTIPPAIAPGLDDVSQRGGWNRPADPDYALPTETWREYVARRQRYEEVKAKLKAGEVTDVNDLITLNLNVVQFAEDVIDSCEGRDLLDALYDAIKSVTVLDPTCGSGAFLFAALTILEPLYDACLDRMQAFIDERDAFPGEYRRSKFNDFEKELAQIDKHPNRECFVLKSIILNNLYGVDIMEEAVEICKLRLFLKLVAQLEPGQPIEPLPDIDFNIRAGNTLVGFARYTEAEMDVGGKLDFSQTLEAVKRDALDLDFVARQFREQQTKYGGRATAANKADYRQRLATLESRLTQYLAREYGVRQGDDAGLHQWRQRVQPFYWFIDFHPIMDKGGFDVVIGNPPWKEYSAVKKEYTVRNFKTERCGNLHCLCTERAMSLLGLGGRASFIVQLPMTSSSRMNAVRDLLTSRCSNIHISTYDDRPGKLFEGLQNCRSTIFIAEAANGKNPATIYTTKYQRWPTEARADLFAQFEHARIQAKPVIAGTFPKYANDVEEALFGKVGSQGNQAIGMSTLPSASKNFIFYQEAARYWIKATVGLPYYAKNGVVGSPAHGRYLYFRNLDTAHAACAVLNSSLFYAYFIAYGDCFHLSDGLASNFPVTADIMRDPCLVDLNQRLMDDLKANAVETTINTRDGDRITYAEFYASKSKPIIDEIDRVLAKHYGFTDEELDFIINYDVKYRMGRDAETAAEGE